MFYLAGGEFLVDIGNIKETYKDFKKNYDYYKKIDKYYYGNTDKLHRANSLPNRSNARIYTNFMQKIVDTEAQYSFGNKVTYKALDEKHKEALKYIDYYFKPLGAGYDDIAGKKLVEFHLGYEIKYINAKGQFRCKWVSPLEGSMAYDSYGDPQFFIYVHTKKELNEKNEYEIVDYIDVYDNDYVYYFDDKFQLLDTKAHNMGCLPVSDGVIDGVKYTEKNGYIEGDKTVYRTIKSLQDGLEQNLSDIVQEITDFHNAILKTFGIGDLMDLTDEDGNVILDSYGNPIKKPPIQYDNDTLYFADKDKQDAQWLIKEINDSFIKNTRDDIIDLIYVLTSHINVNEKMQSNTSGIALRSRLQELEAKCKANEYAMENIIRARIECLFNFLRLKDIGDFDPNLIDIVFTPCVPQDITTLADVISKIPNEVLSNETKRGMLPNVYGNVELEQKRIDRETEASKPVVDLDQYMTHEEDENNEE